MEILDQSDDSQPFDYSTQIQYAWNNESVELELFIAGESNKNVLTILFLHGMALSAQSFSIVTSMLKSRYCIVAVNLRNHGNSSNNQDMVCLLEKC